MELANRQKWLRSLPFGLACGTAGVGIGLLATYDAIGRGWWVLSPLAGISAYLVGVALWRYIVAPKPSLQRGAAAGFLNGILSHYVCWYLFYLYHAAKHYLWEPHWTSPDNPVVALGTSAMGSVISLFILGFVTVPVGMVIGVVVAHFQVEGGGKGLLGVKRPKSPTG